MKALTIIGREWWSRDSDSTYQPWQTFQIFIDGVHWMKSEPFYGSGDHYHQVEAKKALLAAGLLPGLEIIDGRREAFHWYCSRHDIEWYCEKSEVSRKRDL